MLKLTVSEQAKRTMEGITRARAAKAEKQLAKEERAKSKKQQKREARDQKRREVRVQQLTSDGTYDYAR